MVRLVSAYIVRVLIRIADLDESFNLMHDHVLVAELDERLGHSEGQRTQASAEAWRLPKYTRLQSGRSRRKHRTVFERTADKNQSLHIEKVGKGPEVGGAVGKPKPNEP